MGHGAETCGIVFISVAIWWQKALAVVISASSILWSCCMLCKNLSLCFKGLKKPQKSHNFFFLLPADTYLSARDVSLNISSGKINEVN